MVGGACGCVVMRGEEEEWGVHGEVGKFWDGVMECQNEDVYRRVVGDWEGVHST